MGYGSKTFKTVRSMTVLMLSSGLFFGEGVGESGIIIGLVGSLVELILVKREFGEYPEWSGYTDGQRFSDSKNGNGIRITSLV